MYLSSSHSPTPEVAKGGLAHTRAEEKVRSDATTVESLVKSPDNVKNKRKKKAMGEIYVSA